METAEKPCTVCGSTAPRPMCYQNTSVCRGRCRKAQVRQEEG